MGLHLWRNAVTTPSKDEKTKPGQRGLWDRGLEVGRRSGNQAGGTQRPAQNRRSASAYRTHPVATSALGQR